MLGLSGGEECSIIALRCAKMSLKISGGYHNYKTLLHSPCLRLSQTHQHLSVAFFFLFGVSDASLESVNNAHLPLFHFKLSSNVRLSSWGRFLLAVWYRKDRSVPITAGRRLYWEVIPGEPQVKELWSCVMVQSVDFCLKCKAEWRLWFLSRPMQVVVLWLSALPSIDKGTVDVYVIMAGFKERGSTWERRFRFFLSSVRRTVWSGNFQRECSSNWHWVP